MAEQLAIKLGRNGPRPRPEEEHADFNALIYGEENDLPIAGGL
jgi:hypothetical protein